MENELSILPDVGLICLVALISVSEPQLKYGSERWDLPLQNIRNDVRVENYAPLTRRRPRDEKDWITRTSCVPVYVHKDHRTTVVAQWWHISSYFGLFFSFIRFREILCRPMWPSYWNFSTCVSPGLSVLKHHALNRYRRMEINIQALTSALDGGKWLYMFRLVYPRDRASCAHSVGGWIDVDGHCRKKVCAPARNVIPIAYL